MCTLTYIPLDERNFILTNNRDEDISRSLESKIIEINEASGSIVFPVDSEKGGTWIGFNNGGYVACILNAQKTNQESMMEKKSRGLVLLDLLKFPNVKEFVSKYDFSTVDPFLIIFIMVNPQNNSIFEISWNGETVSCTEPGASVPHIWSSPSLYTKEQHDLRTGWFNNFLLQNNIKPSAIRRFHETAGDGNKSYSLNMKRPDGKQTVSLTQIIKRGLRFEISHQNYYNHTSFAFSSNLNQLIQV